MNQSFLFFELIGVFIVHWLILEPQTYVVVEQFGAENIPLLSGRLVSFQVETDNGYLHVTIYKPPPLTKMATVVKKVETGKTLEEDLVPPMPCKCPR